jgi:hypothetical protein
MVCFSVFRLVGLPILAGYVSDAVPHHDPCARFDFAGEFHGLLDLGSGYSY